jgi:hypothetical protein
LIPVLVAWVEEEGKKNITKLPVGARPLINVHSFLALKVPKCEIFDPFFYINKSYMGR